MRSHQASIKNTTSLFNERNEWKCSSVYWPHTSLRMVKHALSDSMKKRLATWRTRKSNCSCHQNLCCRAAETKDRTKTIEGHLSRCGRWVQAERENCDCEYWHSKKTPGRREKPCLVQCWEEWVAVDVANVSYLTDRRIDITFLGQLKWRWTYDNTRKNRYLIAQ